MFTLATKRLRGVWRTRRGRKVLVRLGVFAFILLVIALIIRFLDEPSTGHNIAAQGVPKLVGSSAPPKQATPTPAQTLTNSYFTLSLPPGYAAQAGDPTPAGILYDQTLLKNGDFGSLIITVAVRDLPTGGLSEDSSYQLRQKQTAQYQITNQTLRGEIVRVASDTTTGAVVAFWPHGSYLATISVSSGTDTSSGGDASNETTDIQPLLNAWRWR